MDAAISKSLGDVFALLATDSDAMRAAEDVLRSSKLLRNGTWQNLRWIEFAADGQFIRAGDTDVALGQTHLLSDEEGDAAVRALRALHANRGMHPGELLRVGEPAEIAWALPYDASSATSVEPMGLRVLIFSRGLFEAVITALNPQVKLTNKEIAVLFQVVGGLSLREASEEDGVSFETKRAQMKSLCEKMGCAGQLEIVRQTLGQLVYLLHLSDREVSHGAIAETFIRQFLTPDVQLSLTRVPSGRILRVLEFGPKDGRPLLHFHGMMLPIPLIALEPHLTEHGIRLVVPLREGFLDETSVRSALDTEALIGDSLTGFAEFIEARGMGPVTILGLSFGSILAVRFARLYPHLVRRLVLGSVNLSMTVANADARRQQFFKGIASLTKAPDIVVLAATKYRDLYGRPAIGRTILQRIFGENAGDRRVLETMPDEAGVYAMFADYYRNSVPGIVADFTHVMGSWSRDILDVTAPITFLHGTEDPITGPQQLDMHRYSGDVHLVEGAGHFLTASHPEICWPAIARHL